MNDLRKESYVLLGFGSIPENKIETLATLLKTLGFLVARKLLTVDLTCNMLTIQQIKRRLSKITFGQPSSSYSPDLAFLPGRFTPVVSVE